MWLFLSLFEMEIEKRGGGVVEEEKPRQSTVNMKKRIYWLW